MPAFDIELFRRLETARDEVAGLGGGVISLKLLLLGETSLERGGGINDLFGAVGDAVDGLGGICNDGL